MIHELNLAQPWFDHVASGEKRSKIREHDRGYQAGDTLHLFELDQWGARTRCLVDRDEGGRFVNEWVDNDPLVATVTHVLPAHQFPEGIAPGYCVLSIEVTS